MTTRSLTSLAGLAAISLTAATFAQTTTSPRTSPSTPTRTTPTTPTTTPAPAQPATTPPTTPATGTPTTQPGSPQQPGTAPSTNPNIPPTTNDPNAQPVLPPNSTDQPTINTPVVPGTIDRSSTRVFAVDPTQEARFQQLSQRLARLESQLQASNDRLLQELGEARQMADSNTRIDKLANVMQQVLLQNRTLQQYLVEVRSSLTGQVNVNTTDGTSATGNTGRTLPGSISGPSPSSPRTNETVPTTNGRPSSPVRQSPGNNTPATSPAPSDTPPVNPRR